MEFFVQKSLIKYRLNVKLEPSPHQDVIQLVQI